MKEKGGQIGCLKIENMHKVNMLKGCFFLYTQLYIVFEIGGLLFVELMIGYEVVVFVCICVSNK